MIQTKTDNPAGKRLQPVNITLPVERGSFQVEVVKAEDIPGILPKRLIKDGQATALCLSLDSDAVQMAKRHVEDFGILPEDAQDDLILRAASPPRDIVNWIFLTYIASLNPPVRLKHQLMIASGGCLHALMALARNPGIAWETVLKLLEKGDLDINLALSENPAFAAKASLQEIHRFYKEGDTAKNLRIVWNVFKAIKTRYKDISDLRLLQSDMVSRCEMGLRWVLYRLAGVIAERWGSLPEAAPEDTPYPAEPVGVSELAMAIVNAAPYEDYFRWDGTFASRFGLIVAGINDEAISWADLWLKELELYPEVLPVYVGKQHDEMYAKGAFDSWNFWGRHWRK